MGRPPLDLSIYLVTDTLMCGQLGVVATVSAAVGAGVTAVQLRDTDATDDELVRLGRQVMAALQDTDVALIINDRVHLVEAVGAAGAHVGQSDLDIGQARALLGPAAYLGLSVQSLDQVAAAAELGEETVDYLGVGPVWETTTKLDAAAPGGLETLRQITSASPWPCVAIGGITVDNAAPLIQAGADFIAVSSGVWNYPGGPEKAVKAFNALF